MIDKKNLNEEQLKSLSEKTGNLIQTTTVELTVAFNNHIGTDVALQADRIADAIKEILGILLWVPATGSDKSISKEDHAPTCCTRDETDFLAAFRTCNCGAYGEQGPPTNYWTLMTKFTKVVPKTTRVEKIDRCSISHKYLETTYQCPECGEFGTKEN